MADTYNEVFMDILRREFDPILSKQTRHHYIIERFGLEARLKLNKQPLVNQLPQMELDLTFGSEGVDSASPICVKLNMHQPQIMRILKLLEYIGYYNQFQSGSLTKFKRRTIR